MVGRRDPGTAARLLVATGLGKRFGGVQALSGIDYDVRPREVHALVGENGAGKSTFVRILTGLVEPDEGTVVVSGTPLRPGKRTDPSLISVVYQELSVVPDLSILDNVLLGHEEIGEVYRRKAWRETTREYLDIVGLGDVDLDSPAGGLSLAEQQLIEIARAVSRSAQLLVLDEPTATLSDSEIERVFAAVRRLREAGVGIIYITHRLNEIFELSDRVTVFRNGRWVMTAPTAEVTHTELIREMIGGALDHGVPPTPSAASDRAERLRVLALTLPGAFNDVDLSVAEGEIVGLAGQVGSGSEDLLQTLAGLRPRYQGVVALDGEIVRLTSVHRALRKGLGYVSADRAREGVFLEASMERNMTASVLPRISRFGRVRRGAERRLAKEQAARFRLDVTRLHSPVAELSGGNQQKVSLAKATANAPKVLLINEPTRGVDIGARVEIYRRLRAMAATGVTIVYSSSDVRELMELSDRIVTMFRGRIVRSHHVETATTAEVLRDILHPAEESAA